MPVEVEIRNGSSDLALLLPTFLGEGSNLAGYPRTNLLFEIIDGKGRIVPYVGEPEIAAIFSPARPRACDLIPLKSGDYYGTRVVINRGLFRHDIDAVGRYRMRVRFVSTVREWFSASRREELVSSAEMPDADLRRIISGTFTSEWIEVTVR